MTEVGLPQGISGESEQPIPERVVSWDLTPEDIEKMDEDALRELAVDHQIMLNRMLEALHIVVASIESGTPVTRADIDVITKPEKREDYEALRDRELR